MSFVAKIQSLCRLRGISQAAAERAAGLAENRISKWVSGGEPKAREALRLARLLDVPVEWLVDDRQAFPPPAVDPAEAKLLELARRIGVEVAIDRILANVPAPPAAPPGRRYVHAEPAAPPAPRQRRKPG